MARILVLDTDEAHAKTLADRLGLAGHDTTLLTGDHPDLASVFDRPVDVFIVDPQPRAAGGRYLIQQIREYMPHANILAIGARNTETDAVLALRMGADDYLARPVRMLEFLTRVEAMLRRAAPATRDTGEIEIGGVTVNRLSRMATSRGRALPLTPREFRILERLFLRAGQAVSRAELNQLLGGRSDSARTIDQHVARLRMKLGHVGQRDCLIQTVQGFGYRTQ